MNLIIGQVHPDTAALRRYLVDEGMLDREAGEYWRSGGTLLTERVRRAGYRARHATRHRRTQRARARQRLHAEQAGTAELDVVPARPRSLRGTRGDRRRQRLLGRRPHRRGSRLLLRPRPPRPWRPTEQPRSRILAPRDEVDGVHERRRSRDARHSAADHRGDQRARVRRRHVPHARRRPALRGRVGRSSARPASSTGSRAASSARPTCCRVRSVRRTRPSCC